MKSYHSTKHILLIDQQPCWREASAHALRSAGLQASTLGTYHYFPPQDCLTGGSPDLVVLGCVRIGPEEQELIAQILAYKHHLLVLCASLSWQIMRSLFLQGVDDIAEKPYDLAHVVDTVYQVLESTIPRNGYQAVEREGVA